MTTGQILLFAEAMREDDDDEDESAPAIERAEAGTEAGDEPSRPVHQIGATEEKRPKFKRPSAKGKERVLTREQLAALSAIGDEQMKRSQKDGGENGS